jgi:hypothetical protein
VRHPCTHVTAFLDPVHYECLSKAGALLLDHLVHRRLWSYTRLPIDGLSSVVFHGNSPTLCMGSGNVWVDHYDPAQQRCITPKDALTLDVHPYWRHIFNMPHFFTQGQLVGSCLRVRRVSHAFLYVFAELLYIFTRCRENKYNTLQSIGLVCVSANVCAPMHSQYHVLHASPYVCLSMTPSVVLGADT